MTLVKEIEVSERTPVWRYMRFERFVSFMETHELFFCRPCNFDDRWEGRFPPSFFKNAKRFMDDELRIDLERRLEMHMYGHFVNCWHMGEHESDAMWRLYALSPNGVAIKSTVRKLRENVRPHSDGAVIYYDPSHNIRTETIFSPSDILFKREAFRWENEFRLWFDDEETLVKIQRGIPIDKEKLLPGIGKTIGDMSEVIEAVVVAPGATDSFVDQLRETCRQHRKTSLFGRIERSFSDRKWDSFTE
ncbi:MAG TPA: DUF2971 domain-containing protein [Planctomycetaceae bacterium]|jgi:hypothetical protein|nr:DUF2971 domain-containing protein [Planctomycetaceae bacterium]